MNDSKVELDAVESFPIIKKNFIKYNTPLPSSGPVERLFSFASIINSPKRHALSDVNFESLVLLKANAKYDLFK